MDDVLSYLSSQFSLASLTVKEHITRGVLSDNHQVTDGTSNYFLKKWRPSAFSHLEEIPLVERHMASHGIPVILPLVNRDGTVAVAFKDAWYSLYPYVQGNHIEREDVTGAGLESMAALLARIHHLSVSNSLIIQEQFKWWRSDERALDTIEKIIGVIVGIPSKSEFDEQALESLILKQRIIRSGTARPESFYLASDTLIHGDYHESNMFFHQNAVSHIFDFEKAEMSPRVYELIRSVMLTLINGDFSAINLDRAAQYIAAYSDVYPISPDEVRHGLRIYFTKGVHGYWIEEEHYLRGNNRPDIFMEVGLQSLRFQASHLQELGDAFVRLLL